MRLPVVRGVIDRRILVNWRVDPAALARTLPQPFRPQLVRGRGVAGICLIRFKGLRPRFAPAWAGVSSENAAHRTAVEWDAGGAVRRGVFIRRRDTDSCLVVASGGRLFPGEHHRAAFDVREEEGRYEIALRSDDGVTGMSVRARRADRLPAGSGFASLDEASDFFAAGSVGYSATRDPGRLDGLELRCRVFEVEPLEVEEARSSWLEDESIFPRGSVEFDCALLMRGVEHEWHGQPDLCCASA